VNDIKTYLLICLKLALDSLLFMLNLYVALQYMISGQGGIGWFVCAGLWFFITCTDLFRYGGYDNK
jgi:hypothetical protein